MSNSTLEFCLKDRAKKFQALSLYGGFLMNASVCLLEYQFLVSPLRRILQEIKFWHCYDSLQKLEIRNCPWNASTFFKNQFLNPETSGYRNTYSGTEGFWFKLVIVTLIESLQSLQTSNVSIASDQRSDRRSQGV